MNIIEHAESEIEQALSVERAAFNSEEEAQLVLELLNDPTAAPAISLLAKQDEIPVGHILFTPARLDPESTSSVYLLAPLAVIPEYQRQGIGGALIDAGLQALRQAGCDLCFVLGHPEYYSRFGFTPAGKLGFDGTYPIPDKNADAWMVYALNPDALADASGRVVCADSLNRPEYWIE